MIKNQALESRREADNASKNQVDFFKGKIMGYYSIITLFKHQAFVFCIDQKELSLSEIDPQVDLLGLGRNTEIDPIEDNWAIDPLSEEKIKNYLIDCSMILKEQYIEVRKSFKEAKEVDKEYSKGELTAYHEAISIIKTRCQYSILMKKILDYLI
jgi:hypothetical protein